MDLSVIDTDHLINLAQAAEATKKEADKDLHAFNAELEARMSDLGATRLAGTEYDVEIAITYDWDRTKLHGIRELVHPDVLEGAYIPEHVETIPASWDMRKTKGLAKHGTAVADIIEAAKFEKRRKVVIKERK